jgi:hypothetical protein
MPLHAGSSPAVIHRNIAEMMAAGHPQRQSLAAALRMSRQHADMGGVQPEVPFFERQESRGEAGGGTHGFIASANPGRTDVHPMDVPAGSYVLPADVVSGLGEGNSLAGARLFEAALGSGPFGTRLPRGGGRDTIPRPPPPYSGRPAYENPRDQPVPIREAHGGMPKPGHHEKVPIVAAGGELIVPPDVVKNHPMLGNGDLKRGHRILDHFVRGVRAKTIETLKKLPGPKK